MAHLKNKILDCRYLTWQHRITWPQIVVKTQRELKNIRQSYWLVFPETKSLSEDKCGRGTPVPQHGCANKITFIHIDRWQRQQLGCQWNRLCLQATLCQGVQIYMKECMSERMETCVHFPQFQIILAYLWIFNHLKGRMHVSAIMLPVSSYKSAL